MNRRHPACKADTLPAELSAHITPPHPAYDGVRIGFRSRAGVDQCLPLPTYRCLLLPTSWRKWFSSFLVSTETSRYLVCQVENCTLQHQCRLTDTDLCAGSLPTWILTHIVESRGIEPLSKLRSILEITYTIANITVDARDDRFGLYHHHLFRWTVKQEDQLAQSQSANLSLSRR